VCFKQLSSSEVLPVHTRIATANHYYTPLSSSSKSNVYCSWYSSHYMILITCCSYTTLCTHQTTGMQKAYNFLWGSHGLADEIRASEPGCAYMTNADLISIVGYVAVVQSSGAPDRGCNWYPGRVDYVGFDDTSRLPFEGFNATRKHSSCVSLTIPCSTMWFD
jgi:hypothetical protein